MHTFNNRTASRFNRTVPMYSNDVYVIKAIEKVVDKDVVKKNAEEVELKIRQLQLRDSDIDYVKNELPKKFSYTNNEKLLMANKILFKSFIIGALKEDKKFNSSSLDIEDLDYINSSLKVSLKEYNRILIDEYTELVKEASNKILNTEEKSKDAKITELEKDAKTKDAKITELELGVKTKDAKITELELGVKTKDAKITELEKDAKTKDDRIAELEIGAKTKDDKITELEKDIIVKEKVILEVNEILSSNIRDEQKIKKLNLLFLKNN